MTNENHRCSCNHYIAVEAVPDSGGVLVLDDGSDNRVLDALSGINTRQLPGVSKVVELGERLLKRKQQIEDIKFVLDSDASNDSKLTIIREIVDGQLNGF